jgi:hypothetical protein
MTTSTHTLCRAPLLFAHRTIVASFALVTLFGANSLQAQTNFIWDPNGATAGVGGTGKAPRCDG